MVSAALSFARLLVIWFSDSLTHAFNMFCVLPCESCFASATWSTQKSSIMISEIFERKLQYYSRGWWGRAYSHFHQLPSMWCPPLLSEFIRSVQGTHTCSRCSCRFLQRSVCREIKAKLRYGYCRLGYFWAHASDRRVNFGSLAV